MMWVWAMKTRVSSSPFFSTALLLSVLGHALLVLLVPPATSSTLPSIPSATIHVTLASFSLQPDTSTTEQSPAPISEKKMAPKAPSKIKAPSSVAAATEIKTTPPTLLSKNTENQEESSSQTNSAEPIATNTHLGTRGTTSAEGAESIPLPIQPPRFNAAYLHNPKPTYPPQARRRGIEGKVILQVSVSPEGRVLYIHIHQSSGNASLDEAAQSSVMNWRFVPAQQGDTPISASVRVPIIFKLES